MVYNPNTYTADGSTTEFAITFPFLREADVAVSVFDASGNAVSAFDFEIFLDGSFKARVVADGTITDNTPTPLPVNFTVTVSRATDISTLSTTFVDGVSLRAADINLLLNQQNYALQEFGRNTQEALGKNVTDTAWDATSLRITNLAQPTANNDAVRKVDVDSGIGPAITTVAGIASDVTAVVADQADIGVVSTDLSGSNTIGTVAGSIANVNTVGGAIANVDAVAADQADIGVVAADLSGSDTIGTVAGSIANVNTLAGVSSDVTSLAPQSANIGTLATGTDSGGTAYLTHLANAATNAAAANAALEAFNRTYLGAYSADPTVDGNGDALTDGDLYFNSTSNNLKFYDAGNGVWVTLNNAVQVNSAATLSAVGDANFGTLAENDFIVRDGSNPAKWVNRTPDQSRSALGLGTAATTAASDYATAAQGVTADTALQPNAAADFGGNNITYAANYSTFANLPTASTYHGMFAHTHDTGKPYFAHADNWVELAQQSAVNAKQDTVVTSTALAAASLTTQETGDNGAVSIDVRRANPRTTIGTHTLLGGATLYYASGAATYDVSALTPGDIVTIYCETGTVTVGQGSGSVVLFKDGEATGVASSDTVTIGADTLATVTCVSATKAIIAGSDLT
jgi:hypothetical protein